MPILYHFTSHYEWRFIQREGLIRPVLTPDRFPGWWKAGGPVNARAIRLTLMVLPGDKLLHRVPDLDIEGCTPEWERVIEDVDDLVRVGDFVYSGTLRPSRIIEVSILDDAMGSDEAAIIRATRRCRTLAGARRRTMCRMMLYGSEFEVWNAGNIPGMEWAPGMRQMLASGDAVPCR